MVSKLLAVIVIAFFAAAGSAIERVAPADLPSQLTPWVGWALDGVPDHACPYLYNSDQRRCSWSGPLAVAVAADGGEFDMTLSIYARTWVALPGGEGQWPQSVMVDDSAAVVTTHGGRPALLLSPGRHHVSGRFEWPVLPEILQLPPELGMVQLRVDGAPQPRIAAASGGQLWLQRKAGPVAAGDHVETKVYRQLVDDLPMTVVTVLELDVAGTQREWRTTGMLLAGALPMQLSSPLPARLEADGVLRVQLRPGHWSIELTTRQPSAVARLAPSAAAAPWPQDEVWAFAARTDLRVVEVRGGSEIDPRQTSAPADWQGLPTWRMTPSDALEFVEQRRGDPQPAPDQIELQRDLWLDFDGGGLTVQDHLSGQITRLWRLDAGPGLALGQVSLNGEPQFITQSGSAARGVEVRRGALDLQADSRLARGAIPAVGWAFDVKQLSARLHLPPGWQLWAARGVDNVPDTWLKRWTLLDLFLVLIVTLAVARLFSRRWALLCLLTLALIWHEGDAPRQVWIHLLVAQALLSVLPAHHFRRLVSAYRNGALAVMAVLCLGFMITQLRVGLYPQLARAAHVLGAETVSSAGVATEALAPAAEAMVAMDQSLQAEGGAMAGMAAKAQVLAAPRAQRKVVPAAHNDIDPHATIQTGPGLPAWDWVTVPLTWTGPVKQDQTIQLYLSSPRLNLGLAVLRVVLLSALMLMFLRDAVRGSRAWLAGHAGVPALVLMSCWLGVGGLPSTASAALPDAALLQELTNRLTRAPDCMPSCATVPRLRVELRDEILRLRLEVHTAAAVAVPLPGGAEQWLPRSVVVNGNEQRGMFRDEAGVLWLELPAGHHRVDVQGAVPDGASFQLPLVLPPQHLETALEGWSMSGQRPDGGAEPQLIFTRLAQHQQRGEQSLEPRALPAFVRVERVLQLGLDWRVETRVSRLTPPDSAVALAIPVLTGESVTTPNVRVVDGRVQVNLATSESEFAWSSVLSQSTPLVLTAPDSKTWVETWRADIAPLWHAELAGLAVVHHQDEQGQWLPSWQPWPGESVRLSLTRPLGVAGQSLTIDNSRLVVRPAQRASDFALDFTVRSSQGGQHVMSLPADATLERVAINDVVQPLRQDGNKLTLPVVPGVQRFTLNWHNASGMRALYRVPDWSLGSASVNASLALALPEDRWVLLAGGPRLGPAVLFWGVLLVWCLVAIALGRTRITPLSTSQWLLLIVGLTQIDVAYALLVIAWPFALVWRQRVGENLRPVVFNALQVGLALFTLLALALLFGAIKQGLLGQPDMQIAGNGSHAGELRWFADRVAGAFPSAWVVSVSLWLYRGLMLAWALWLAFALLDWLRWAWRCFSAQGLWRAPLAVDPPAGQDSSAPPAAVLTPDD